MGWILPIVYQFTGYFRWKWEKILKNVLLAAIVMSLLGLFFWIFTHCQRNANKYIDDGYLDDGKVLLLIFVKHNAKDRYKNTVKRYYPLTTNLSKFNKPSETIKLEPLEKTKGGKVVPIVEV